jgi:hypothetical protein
MERKAVRMHCETRFNKILKTQIRARATARAGPLCSYMNYVLLCGKIILTFIVVLAIKPRMSV